MVAWSRDTKTLITLGQNLAPAASDNGKWFLSSLDVNTGAEKIILTMGPEQRFWGDISNSSMISMAPDGKSITATSATLKSDVWVLEGFPRPRSWLARFLWWR